MPTDTIPEPPLDRDLRVEAVDLIGRPGSHRHISRALAASGDDLETNAMRLPAGEELEIEADLESVVEGIYVHGTVSAHLDGECSRCLDPVDQDVDARFDELVMYPEKVRADEREDSVLLDGDDVELGPLVRDAIALEADERPLCREDCPGLCPQCGFRMEDDPEHGHDVIDDRFAKLQGLFGTEAPGDADGPGAGEDEGAEGRE